MSLGDWTWRKLGFRFGIDPPWLQARGWAAIVIFGSFLVMCMLYISSWY